MSKLFYSDHMPAEPILIGEVHQALVMAFVGDKIAFANARSGRSARRLPAISIHVEADEHLVKAAGASSEALKAEAAAKAAEGEADEAEELEDAAATVEGRDHICAPAHRTGLADASLTTYVVDHVQNEPDLMAVIVEARRLLVPGGRLVLIHYSRPQLADLTVDDPLRWSFEVGELDRHMIRDTLLETTYSPEKHFKPRDYALRNATACCQATLPELLGYMGASPAPAAFIKSDPDWAIEMDAQLARAWGDPSKAREIWFNVALIGADVSGTLE